MMRTAALLCVQAALLCYAVRLTADLWDLRRSHSSRLIKWIWLAGGLLLATHIVLVFQAYHDWSWTAAVEHTARETERVVGTNFGGGIWFNFLTLGVWFADAGGWIAKPAAYVRRSALWDVALHAFLSFIVINATIVFHSGTVRLVAILFLIFASFEVLAKLSLRIRHARLP